LAHSLSARKRIRQNEKRRIRNKSIKTEVRTYIKKLQESISLKNKEEAQNALNIVIKAIDKAVSKNIYHKNNGARKKSRLNKLVKSL